MIKNIKLFCHNSIKITGSKTIYIDPFKIDKEYNDADFIFSTHPHYDHFSEDDIRSVMNNKTVIITPEGSRGLANDLTHDSSRVMIVERDNEYSLDGVSFKTTYAYNKEKMYHPKKEGWLGYLIELDGIKYYIAGDTDNVREIANIKCDVAFIPIGGKYTMDYKEAAELANSLDAKVIVPTHYGLIVGEKEDAEKFKALVSGKDVEILIK